MRLLCSLLGLIALFMCYNSVHGNISLLRDVKFSPDYNKNEMPPNHNGKPLSVRNFIITIN